MYFELTLGLLIHVTVIHGSLKDTLNACDPHRALLPLGVGWC